MKRCTIDAMSLSGSRRQGSAELSTGSSNPEDAMPEDAMPGRHALSRLAA
jgi:hypothetical protein